MSDSTVRDDQSTKGSPAAEEKQASDTSSQPPKQHSAVDRATAATGAAAQAAATAAAASQGASVPTVAAGVTSVAAQSAGAFGEKADHHLDKAAAVATAAADAHAAATQAKAASPDAITRELQQPVSSAAGQGVAKAAAVPAAAGGTVGKIASAASQIGQAVSAVASAIGAGSAKGATASVASALGGGDGAMFPTTVQFDVAGVAETWQVDHATVTEALNTPYQARIDVRCDEKGAEPQAMLGQSAKLLVERGGLEHPFHGVIHRVEEGAGHKEWATATLFLAPAIHLLRHTRQSRVHRAENAGDKVDVKTTLETVIGKALEPFGREVAFDLDRQEYPTYEHRIQYDESDFDFCSRLMEEEGLFYWFDQSGDAEKLTISDHRLKFKELDADDGKDVTFVRHEGTRGLEGIGRFMRNGQVVPNTLHAVHYEHTQPHCHAGETDKGDEDRHGAHLGPERQVFEHDLCPARRDAYDLASRAGDKVEKQLKEQIRIRREEYARDAIVADGDSTVVGFAPGLVFTLNEHPEPALNGDYLLTSVTHDIAPGSYDNEFSVIPADTPFRPTRMTQTPRINGIESATVATSDGEEIETDLEGRIKVQFHWDREGEHNQHSSCFVRVMQPWAGGDWGFHFLPRVGMEVAVSFVQGDPDRPVVIGTLYNGQHMPPYGGADNPEASKTRSTIRTQSSKGGDGYNELSFEDEKDKEEVFIQAQKNMRELVKNNHTSNILAYRSETVGAGAEQFVAGGASRTVDGGLKEAITAGDNKLEQMCTSIAVDRTVEGDVTESITGNESRTVSADFAETVTEGKWATTVNSKNMALTVATAGQDLSLSQGGGEHSFVLKDRVDLDTTTDFKLKNEKVTVSTDGGKLLLHAADEISLQCGQTHITLTKDGKISIHGPTEVVMGSGNTAVKTTPAAIETSSTAIKTAAIGTHEITGAVVKIN